MNNNIFIHRNKVRKQLRVSQSFSNEIRGGTRYSEVVSADDYTLFHRTGALLCDCFTRKGMHPNVLSPVFQ